MYDITFLANAPVDVLLPVTDETISSHNLNKGDWMQVPVKTLEAILADVPADQREIMPGGSAANTAHIFASLGGKANLCAYVGDEEEGRIFYDSMRDKNIEMPAPLKNKRTLIIYVLMTPDGERTMITPKADEAALPRALVQTEDIDENTIKNSRWLYIEGYLLADNFPAIIKACRIARQHGTKIALTLAAPHFVETFFSEIAMLVRDGIDLYLCNEHELATLKSAELTGDDAAHAEETMARLKEVPHLVTYGKDGATYQDPQEKTHVATQPADNIVDATGAGDAFAAGYFYGFLNDYNREEAINLGHKMAGKVIQQVGARLPDIAF